jgi:hypothetical protein
MVIAYLKKRGGLGDIDARQAGFNDKEKRELARQVAFQLLGLISTGAVLRAAEWIGSERLEEDIAKVVANNPQWLSDWLKRAHGYCFPVI